MRFSASCQKKEIFSEGKYVVLSICLAKLFDMAMGLNAEILLYSTYYRVITLFVIIMAVFSIAANKLLIPLYDINGAAWATSLTTLVYCITRVWYVWHKFRIHPFSHKTWLVILITFLTFAAVIWIPFPASSVPLVLFTLFVRSILITALFVFFILRLRVSPQINELVLNLWDKALSLRKK